MVCLGQQGRVVVMATTVRMAHRVRLACAGSAACVVQQVPLVHLGTMQTRLY